MNDKNHLDVITDYVSLNDLGHFSSVAVIFFCKFLKAHVNICKILYTLSAFFDYNDYNDYK